MVIADAECEQKRLAFLTSTLLTTKTEKRNLSIHDIIAQRGER